eukprot:5831154-Lingulodinium_polyedra.AAC.1
MATRVVDACAREQHVAMLVSATTTTTTSIPPHFFVAMTTVCPHMLVRESLQRGEQRDAGKKAC